MSNITARGKAPRKGASVDDRLARLLDSSFLAGVVPHVPAETLHQLIRHRGLDACGELVASATPAQLTVLLDLDLWRPAAPGRDEQFDVDRFGEWLEVLVNTGPSVAARTVAALDQNLVVAGLSSYVRVFDPGIFEPTAQTDDEPPDRREAMREGDSMDGDPLECEVAGYIVRARRADAWNAIVTLLVTLDAEHGDCFHAVMQGCRGLSNSRPEIDGLDDLLQAPAQHFHDVTIEREHRRSQHGYATPGDARAFLQMARQPAHKRAGLPSAVWLTGPSAMEASPSRAIDAIGGGAEVPETVEAVIELLADAGVMPTHPRALLASSDTEERTSRLTRLQPLMEYVRDTDEGAYFARSQELASLANMLLAGCSVQSRPFTPQEASQAAACVCNLGLEHWPARWRPSLTSHGPSAQGRDAATATPSLAVLPDSFLIDCDLVTAFEVGWSVLHHDVSLFVAQQLIATLNDVRFVEGEVQHGLVALRRALVRQRDAGTPWLARGAAEVLAMLDMTAWVSVLGLLDECPVVSAALTAILDGRTTAVSATAFDFISTAAQIDNVRAFMRKLPDVLSR